MKALLPLMLIIFITGCAGLSLKQQDTLTLSAAAGTAETINQDRAHRAVLEELSVSLDAFCGQGPVDKLALIGFLREKLGPKTGTRLGFLMLLVDESKINPKDTVAWGNAACSLRDGIKQGLALTK